MKAAAHCAPSAGGAGPSLAFTATVAGGSGVQSLKALVWPASSGPAPRAGETKAVENATCRTASSTTSLCTYGMKDSAKDAAAMPGGTRYVSALATAKDRDTTFAPSAATFTVEH
ncbi:DUF5707 domain-containing protein [Streptomyces sp. IBSBF 2435]|uniref:DUF5707 domain-containing protein n=1 Tax=Streptomyces sp. IBSBF 2435 TaxID=2903531 RepID=UPI002FDB9D28